MKFVADENVPGALIVRLRADGHEVVWITKTHRRLKDPPIIDLAWREGAIIITNDSDFQRHILKEKQPAHGVVWLRVGWMSRTQRNERAYEAIRDYQDRLLDHFTTIYPDRVEQERLGDPGKNDMSQELTH